MYFEEAGEFLKKLVDGTEYHLRSYSGRGMYGAECVGVVADDLQTFFGDVIESSPVDLDRWHLGFLLKNARTDGMGRQTIIYWPELEWNGEMYGEEEEDD